MVSWRFSGKAQPTGRRSREGIAWINNADAEQVGKRGAVTVAACRLPQDGVEFGGELRVRRVAVQFSEPLQIAFTRFDVIVRQSPPAIITRRASQRQQLA